MGADTQFALKKIIRKTEKIKIKNFIFVLQNREQNTISFPPHYNT